MGRASRGVLGYAFRLGANKYAVLLREKGSISDMIGIMAHETVHVVEWIAPGKSCDEARAGLVGEIVRIGAAELFGGKML